MREGGLVDTTPVQIQMGGHVTSPQSRDAIQATQVLPSRLATPCKYAAPRRRLRTPRHHAVQVPAPPCRPTALAPPATPTLRLRTPRHHTVQVPPHYDATCVMAVPAATPTLLSGKERKVPAAQLHTYTHSYAKSYSKERVVLIGQ